MCGIYGLLSSSSTNDSTSVNTVVDSFFGSAERLLQTAAGSPSILEPKTCDLLDETRENCHQFVERDGFIGVLCDNSLRTRLAETSKAISDWVKQLETFIDKGNFRSQKEAEVINELIVGGRDLVWEIDRDILGNLDKVRDLLGGKSEDEFPMSVWSHGWALNLVLNGIDRLEVRGRDSAGVAIFVRFSDGAALEQFVSSIKENDELAQELSERTSVEAMRDRAILQPSTCNRTLLFAFKVANEVGEMGDNVRYVRSSIATDRIFQRALREAEIQTQVLAHTRWASNGIVSVRNCHPVDSAICDENDAQPKNRGCIVAVLNGDIDNYQDLYARYLSDSDLALEPEITTDAKIIPVVIQHHYEECGNLEQAFRRAFDEFEGSMAIGIMAADNPGKFLFAQKGSGQGLYIGLAPTSTVIASEMYGVVELTQSYLKADGEKVEGGEIFCISQKEDATEVAILDGTQPRPFPKERIRQAEITTRDINRGEFPHFLLKEISESVETVRKTLRGKFEISQSDLRFLLGKEVLDPERLRQFQSGKIRRIILVGQGTAAIAGDGVAALLSKALQTSPHPIHVRSMKATELSGHHLREDMSDSLVIAISQSGTTTDTNRTVDLAKERGAWIIGIVNRRNSDLVYKSHGVLYTSDGRDIEMSVASTKAFYAQNVAGQVLALALAQAVGALDAAEIRRQLGELVRLPAAMEETLSLSDHIREVTQQYAPRRKYWAVVGSGPGKIAADEIRIKLSELCYKSIATDYLEDKKHIDLSSEPLVLVCANGAPEKTISDIVKEVAIFNAHQSIPIVIADAGETRFDPYAAGVIRVPDYKGTLNYLLTTMVGHLFGYHAASSFDRLANKLRTIRTGILKALQTRPQGANGSGFMELSSLDDELIDSVREFQDILLDGGLDSCLEPATSVELALLFQVTLGRVPSRIYGSRFGRLDTATAVLERVLQTLSHAISELARPIDAIKHQAKTVTVGISRIEETRTEGALWSVLRSYDIDCDLVPESQKTFLSAFEPLVAQVEGTVLYRVDDLDAVGRPRDGSTVRVEHKTGCTVSMLSRCEEEAPLSGTKWGVVRSRETYLGYGQTDGKRIVIVPILGESSSGHLLLYHIEMAQSRDLSQRTRALTAHRTLFEKLRIAVTEHNQVWDPSLLNYIDNETLFFEDPNRVAEKITSTKAVEFRDF